MEGGNKTATSSEKGVLYGRRLMDEIKEYEKKWKEIAKDKCSRDLLASGCLGVRPKWLVKNNIVINHNFM